MGLGAFDNLDLYDYLTFVTLIVLAAAFFSIAMWILGLPGRIAISRRHPHAEAVKLMGWVGFLAVIPWVHALIWSMHDAITIDVRRGPKELEDATDQMLRKMTGESEAVQPVVAQESKQEPAKEQG